MSKFSLHVCIVAACLVVPQSIFAAVREYHLNISEQTVNVTGKPVKKLTVNGQFPAPTLTFEDGDDAVIYVHNQLKKQETALHWHGVLLPAVMDGVPGFNGFQGIAPNGDFVYRFKIRQTGTYWYHAHSAGQEQDGLYGALIIYPKNHQPITSAEKTDRDEVIMFSDFHESSSEQIMNNLKKSSDYYQNQRETLADVWKQTKQQGLKDTWQDRRMWNQMRMLKTDLSDVTGYHFLVNGKTPQQNWTSTFKTGEKIRLRMINASAMSFFDVRIPNLKMTVVSADGQPVQPVAVDEFRFGAGETYDVIVEPKQSQYQIQAESIDRSGFALATLRNQDATVQPLPEPQHRPRALLNMQDMGMMHENTDHSSNPTQHDMSNMQYMDMSEMDMSKMQGMTAEQHQKMMQQMNHSSMSSEHKMSDMQDMDMSKMQGMTAEQHQKMMQQMNHSMSSEHQMSDMQGMDMSKMQGMTAEQHQKMMQQMNHSMSSEHQMSDMQDMDMSKTNGMTAEQHQQMMQQMSKSESDHMTQNQTAQQMPTPSEKTVVEGWANASTPSGLKALSYADLRPLFPQKDTRPAQQEIVLHLGGNMERYIWTMNGKKFNQASPIQVQYGERVRLTFVNDSMMAHPMHLHGMFVQLENGQPLANLPNKHTIIVSPGQKVSVLLTADELGEWAIHCHLLYHMSAGMMNKLVVAKVKPQDSQMLMPMPAQGGNVHAHH
ncbi:copper oxidase [Acinetobacter sp. ANC 4633]|uniref:multicopper oxidase domain-containing protein n=1 Tax=Acinetobacter sp. ANC 4633 TaxID=2529845 RepID=UPI00103D9CE0|nr:multicopper oxidase domain-containing protein [Acinetobacter sp. ANC 4633]TCB26516.1 copper oxidase [Acinetobacter sp. ANC 4633]